MFEKKKISKDKDNFEIVIYFPKHRAFFLTKECHKKFDLDTELDSVKKKPEDIFGSEI